MVMIRAFWLSVRRMAVGFVWLRKRAIGETYGRGSKYTALSTSIGSWTTCQKSCTAQENIAKPNVSRRSNPSWMNARIFARSRSEVHRALHLHRKLDYLPEVLHGAGEYSQTQRVASVESFVDERADICQIQIGSTPRSPPPSEAGLPARSPARRRRI